MSAREWFVAGFEAGVLCGLFGAWVFYWLAVWIGGCS